MTNGNGNGVKQYNEGAAADSVQFRSQGDLPQSGSPFDLQGIAFHIHSFADELPGWWSRQRDRFLRTILHNEPISSGVVFGEVARVQNMPFTLTHEDDNQDELAKWQKVLQLADFGKGFNTFVAKLALDRLSQDNGCHFEILGDGDIQYITETFYRRIIGQDGKETELPYESRFLAKGERTSEAKGIAYLDSGQCWRTMNPEWPIIYENPFSGLRTVLHWTRVSSGAQFVQGYELGRNLGLCALSRAYMTIRHIQSVNLYYFEKITGQSPELYVANQPVAKLEQAITGGIFNRDNKGQLVFSDPIIIAPKSGGVGAQELKISKVGLRDVPDGFDYKTQIDIAVNALALAFGVDVREIWAATQTGATKADAEIQDVKTTGKGRADILSYLENEINWRVLPPEITFRFDEVDDLADERKARIRKIRVDTRATQIQSGELNLIEAREMAAEFDDIMPEFLERVATADDMTDVEAVNATSGGVAPKEADPDAEDVSELEVAESKKKDELGHKAYSQTRGLFFRNLTTFVELAVARQVSSRNFMSSLKGELQLAGRAAFLDGIRAGVGNFSIGENELSPDEITLRDNLIATQISYAGNLRDFAFTDPPPEFIEVISRVALWAAKGLDGIYNAGRLMGAGNKLQKWIYGDTRKHCDTCSAAAGQVHRAKSWLSKGIVPKGDKLLCNGFRCDCRLEDTADPVSGRLDRIPVKGGKHIHENEV